MQTLRQWIFKVAYFGYNTSLGRRYWLRKLNDWHVHANAHNLTAHSVTEPEQYGRVEVVPIPVGFDNYSYLIRCEGIGVLVDVGDPEAVLSTLNELGVSHINAILITHKHWDHQHGADIIAAKYEGCVLYGGVQDFSGSSSVRTVNDGSEINVGNWLKFLAISTPGHTSGHTCYLLRSSLATDSSGNKVDIKCNDMLFSGDHLFLYGCGRVFECPFPVMLESFEKLLSLVSDRALMFPGHEYTLINLQFTLHVLPDDPEVIQCFETALRLRLSHRKTCPETWAQQKRCNLFLRYKDEALLKKLAAATGTPESEASPLELFSMLRKLKDQFSNKSKNSDGSSASGQASTSIATVVAKLQQERLLQEGEAGRRAPEPHRRRSPNSGSSNCQQKSLSSLPSSPATSPSSSQPATSESKESNNCENATLTNAESDKAEAQST